MTNLGYTAQEPIAAIATALSPAALGIVRTSGKHCLPLVASVFSRPQALLEAEGNSLVYGWIVEKGADGAAVRRIDEVMVGVYRGPRSFTGEDMAEIFCHGGISVVQSVLALLLRTGFRQARRGEFTFRSYINGKADLTKAEAVREIIDSRTDGSRARAAGRLAGGLYRKLESLKRSLTDILASIEVAVEYPEDEETIADSFGLDPLRRLQEELAGLLDSWQSERLYQEGARIVLAGRTNAGKSSLFNALLKEDRSIVSEQEGTTRDYLETELSLGGIPARIFDTAGLRQSDDPVEGEGMQRTKTLAGEADLLLYLVDSAKGLCAEDRAFLSAYGGGRPDGAGPEAAPPLVLVWNKCDRADALELPESLPPKSPGGQADSRPDRPWTLAVAVSAKTGAGLGELATRAKELLAGARGTDRDGAALGSLRQKDACAAAFERVSHALDTAQSGELGLDAVVQDLEDALDSLGEITGEVTSDDVLESIFSSFCVGK